MFDRSTGVQYRPRLCLRVSSISWEDLTIVDNVASPSIYNNRQFRDPELVPRLCEDMIAHVVRLIRSPWKGVAHGDALGLADIEGDSDTAIGHASWWCLPEWCERSAASAVDSRLLTIPELYLACLEGLPERSNSAVSHLDQ